MRFLVYQNGSLAQQFNLSATYLFAADMIPLRQVDSITFSDGVIECRRKGMDAAGLALLWSVPQQGKLLLPTTRLPERDEPYLLNLELARARLMQITLKREDWALFEETDKLADLAHEAQGLFIEALQHISDPAQASLLADQALQKGLAFSEKLSSKYADQYLALRYRNKGLSKHSLGCVLDPQRMDDAAYRKNLLDMFGFVTLPFNWGQIEIEHGKFDYTALDRAMDHLAGKGVVCGGPLLCFEPSMLPAWLKQQNPDFEKIRECAYSFVSRTVTRYSKYVHFWRVISGMNAFNHFEFTFEQIIEMTRTACLAARAADPKSRKIVEIVNLWGEYYATDKATVPPLVYADVVIQSGISFDSFGVAMRFGGSKPGMHIRDMMQIASRLDCFAPVNKPLHITAVSVPSGAAANDENCEQSGYWHRPWDETLQAEWLEQFYKAALGRPYINSVTYAQFADGGKNSDAGFGLMSEDISARKAYISMAKFQKFIMKQ